MEMSNSIQRWIRPGMGRTRTTRSRPRREGLKLVKNVGRARSVTLELESVSYLRLLAAMRA